MKGLHVETAEHWLANAFYTPIKQVAVTVTLWTFIWEVSNSDLSCVALQF
jgi:hypothetical protein